MAKSNKKDMNSEICISCMDCDKSFINDYFLEKLQSSGFSVWYASKPKQAEDNGLAIVQCKIFVPILSEESVQSEKFNDEISLAYVANKSVVPVALKNIRKINTHLNSGVKLMLAKINWTFFTKPERYDEMMPKLVEALRQELNQREQRKQDNPAVDTEQDVYGALNQHAPDIDIQGGDDDIEPSLETCEHIQKSINCDFWERHFKSQKDILWTDFKAKFLSDYGERITRQLGGGKDTWMTLLLYKDIFELHKRISRDMYMRFSGQNTTANPDHFYDRVKEYAVGISAMRNVFNMDSSVRLVAIQNLGAFQTPAVITLLFDLVDDSDDPNCRALASLALAKSGRKSHRIEDMLIKLLKDEDRVVRESACLSLAHIKCIKAVPHILDRWRNDAIKHVREAAELALSRMGGAEAEQAIRVTQVLTGEMQTLRQQAAH